MSQIIATMTRLWQKLSLITFSVVIYTFCLFLIRITVKLTWNALEINDNRIRRAVNTLTVYNYLFVWYAWFTLILYRSTCYTFFINYYCIYCTLFTNILKNNMILGTFFTSLIINFISFNRLWCIQTIWTRLNTWYTVNCNIKLFVIRIMDTFGTFKHWIKQFLHDIIWVVPAWSTLITTSIVNMIT